MVQNVQKMQLMSTTLTNIAFFCCCLANNIQNLHQSHHNVLTPRNMNDKHTLWLFLFIITIIFFDIFFLNTTAHNYNAIRNGWQQKKCVRISLTSISNIYMKEKTAWNVFEWFVTIFGMTIYGKWYRCNIDDVITWYGHFFFVASRDVEMSKCIQPVSNKVNKRRSEQVFQSGRRANAIDIIGIAIINSSLDTPDIAKINVEIEFMHLILRPSRAH